MSELKVFTLPDVGEGLTEADILRWDVKVGEHVEVNQTLVEVETAKAAVELPAPFAGVVHAIHVEAGATVDVGVPIVTIRVGDDDPAGSPAAGPPPSEAPPAAAQPVEAAHAVAQPAATQPAREAVLVGYGVSAHRGRRRRAPAAAEPAPSAHTAFTVPADQPADGHISAQPLAKPPVRKLAKSLGIDLAGVLATGPNGSVSRDDVERAAQHRAPPGGERRTDRYGAVERIPIRGVRKHTAAAMTSSAFTAPHVTEFVTVDLTETMALRERVAARREFRSVKVSPLLFVTRAALWALRRTPILNSTWDEAAGEIAVKHYVNLGIAAATDRGLIVPNIKNAHELSLLELAYGLAELTETARSGRTTPADMTGGTFTITNVGVFGIDTGTPIINPGEAAIMAVGAIRRQPWVVGSGTDERIEPRWVTQLAVSFDHRSVDGQQGSEFLADVAAVLHDPGLALL